LPLDDEGGHPKRRGGPSRAGLLFAALLASWLVFPLGQRTVVAQDALAYLTAGRLVGPHDGAIYAHKVSSTAWELDPRFARDACHLAPAGTDCHRYVVPFLSPPQALPLSAGIGHLGRDLGPLVFRWLAVGGLVAGMAILWRRRDTGVPGSSAALVVTAAFMTPFAYESSIAGQTSSLLFLSACIGLTATARRPALYGAAATWAGVIAFKLFPAALAVPLILRRRWRLLVWTAAILAGLTVLAAVMSPRSFGDFLGQLRPTTATQTTNTANISLDAVIRLLLPGWGTTSGGFAPVVLLRLAVVLGVGALVLRIGDDDLLWAYSWVALLAVEPVVWWHYAAVFVALAAALARRRPGWTWLIPVSAVPLYPLALGSIDTGALAVVIAVMLVAAFAVIGSEALGLPGRLAPNRVSAP
jgi:hypothetical protein